MCTGIACERASELGRGLVWICMGWWSWDFDMRVGHEAGIWMRVDESWWIEMRDIGEDVVDLEGWYECLFCAWRMGWDMMCYMLDIRHIISLPSLTWYSRHLDFVVMIASTYQIRHDILAIPTSTFQPRYRVRGASKHIQKHTPPDVWILVTNPSPFHSPHSFHRY